MQRMFLQVSSHGIYNIVHNTLHAMPSLSLQNFAVNLLTVHGIVAKLWNWFHLVHKTLKLISLHWYIHLGTTDLACIKLHTNLNPVFTADTIHSLYILVLCYTLTHELSHTHTNYEEENLQLIRQEPFNAENVLTSVISWDIYIAHNT